MKFAEFLVLFSVLSVSGSEKNNFASIGSCSTALGMEKGHILDSAITASSSYDPKSVGPQNARVRQEKNGGAWCPKAQISSKVREYLEIDLMETHLITYTETQGRFGNGQGQEYAEQFAIEYWREPLKNWVIYKNHKGEKLLSGNTNTYLGVKQKLELPFVASKIRFVPFSEHPRTVCMRVEIYGCLWQQNLVSYAAPRADTEFEDVSYDGIINDRNMKDGLGQLTDNVFGDEDFLNHNQQTNNKKWVGWLNDQNISSPLEIIFEFKTYSQIFAIFLHISHFKTREVQMFSKVEVFTSIDGIRFHQNSVKIKPQLNRLRDGTHNITIYSDVKIAKYMKLKLYFSARWILISEVQFDIRSVDSNKTDELLLQYGSLVDSGVQPHQSAEDKINNKKGLKISFINLEAYIIIFTIFGILLLISAVSVMILMLKKTRQTKLMRKHAVLPTNTTLPRAPIALKELEIATPIIDNLNGTRCRQLRTRDLVKSTGNIYSDINRSRNDSEESDTSSLYHEPYTRVQLSQHDCTRMKQKESKKIDEHGPANFNEERKYSSISLYNLSTQFPPIISRNQTSYSSIHNPLVTYDKSISDISESYYAAAAIIQEESAEQQLKLGKFTTLKLPLDLDDLCEYAIESKPPLLEFSRYRLRVIEKLGEGNFGMIHLCETELTSSETYGHTMYHKKQVIVKSMRRGISEEVRTEFFRECNQLATIRDPNISKIIGICSKEDPVSALQEYSEFGDLSKFLHSQITSNADTSPIININFLLYLAAQIASAMKYLESRKIVHRDLATRNCMVGKNYMVKVSDHAIYCAQYENDYYITDKKSRLPIRWMAWESVLLGNYSSRSDVWSFAVTLWEILLLCEQRPFGECTNEQVIENFSNYYRSVTDKIKLLNWPSSCPKDIYELMKECWRRNNIERPSFTEIHFFLQRKILGYKPSLQL